MAKLKWKQRFEEVMTATIALRVLPSNIDRCIDILITCGAPMKNKWAVRRFAGEWLLRNTTGPEHFDAIIEQMRDDTVQEAREIWEAANLENDQ